MAGETKENPVSLDPAQGVVGVQWGTEITNHSVVIESRHMIGNNARIAWHQPPPKDALTHYVGNVPPDWKGFPDPDNPFQVMPKLGFPTTEDMAKTYNFWFAQHMELRQNTPNDSATDAFIVNLDKFEDDLLVIIHLLYTTPNLVPQGAAVLSRYFTHGTFGLVKVYDPGQPIIVESPSKDGLVFEIDQDINSYGGSSDKPGNAKGMIITIVRLTQVIIVQPIF